MLSKSCEYAMRAVFYISVKGQEGNNVGIKEIAKELDIPAPFLAKILQSLVKNKILSSVKGPNGGFTVKSIKKLSMMDIIEAVDGLEVFRKCTIGLKRCSDIKPCPVHHLVKPYREELKAALSQKTLEQAVKELEENRAFI